MPPAAGWEGKAEYPALRQGTKSPTPLMYARIRESKK